MSELGKRYRANYDRIAEEFSKVSQETRTIASLVGYDLRWIYYNHPRRPLRVLDVGCGSGWITKDLHFAVVVNTDISVKQLKSVSGKARLAADAEALPLKDSMADVVVCSDVLEHVLDPKEMASEITRVLRPHGDLLLAVPWEQDLSAYDDPRYEKRYEFVHLRSIGGLDIYTWFPNYRIRNWTDITNQCPGQWSPYNIKYMHLENLKK